MKTLLKVGVIAILLIVVAGAVLGVYLDSLIKSGVEAVGPKITGTAVKLVTVALSPFSGKVQLKGLVVDNPQGFKTARAFQLAEAKVHVDLKSALSDRLIIEEILIDGPEITYEAGPSGTNIGRIQQNVAAFGKSAGTKEAPEAQTQKKDPTQKKVQINHFIVRSGTVTLSASMLKGKPVTLPLPDIHLRDIGKDSGGVTVQKAAAEMVSAINKAAVQTVASSGKFLEKGVEAAEEAAKSIGSEGGKSGSKTFEGVKGLLGK